MGNRSTKLIFFATAEDLRPLLAIVESTDFSSSDVACLLRKSGWGFLTLATLGIALAGDSNREPSYLVAHGSASIEVRAVAQKRGAIKYAVDQMRNPGTIVLRPGGKYSESVVIAGMVGTVSRDPDSIELMTAFSDQFRRSFIDVRGNWVGHAALDLLRAGGRLTSDVRSSIEYDLVA